MSLGTDWALITGAGSGIGTARRGAQALSARSVGVLLVGRRQARLDAVRESLGRRGPTLIVPADIASAAARARLGEAVEKRLSSEGGRLRHLVHHAGIGALRPDCASTGQGWHRKFRCGGSCRWRNARAVARGQWPHCLPEQTFRPAPVAGPNGRLEQVSVSSPGVSHWPLMSRFVGYLPVTE